jgi:hypothetical protein
MNLSDPQHPWNRLVSAARRMSDDGDAAAPFGFSTRVAANAFQRAKSGSLFERFALRALGIACVLALGSVAVNYSVLTENRADDEASALTDDPVAQVLDLS